MKRLTFLAGLLGLPLLGQKRKPEATEYSATTTLLVQPPAPPTLYPGGIQVWQDSVNDKAHLAVDGRELHWFSGNALNGQCPTCGTMAEPLAHAYTSDGAWSQTQLTRCKRCCSAFWQDSEGRMMLDAYALNLIAAYAFALAVIGILRTAAWALDRFLAPPKPENHRITVVRE